MPSGLALPRLVAFAVCYASSNTSTNLRAMSHCKDIYMGALS